MKSGNKGIEGKIREFVYKLQSKNVMHFGNYSNAIEGDIKYFYLELYTAVQTINDRHTIISCCNIMQRVSPANRDTQF